MTRGKSLTSAAETSRGLHDQGARTPERTPTAQDIIDDHGCRSGYLRHLTCVLSESGEPASDAPIPRVIVQFWDDPASVPADVLECMTSWAVLEDQGFRRETYGDSSARAFIHALYGNAYAAAFDACPHPAMQCHLFKKRPGF
jgi:mannosyltransferase OCH1-like enzyme